MAQCSNIFAFIISFRKRIESRAHWILKFHIHETLIFAKLWSTRDVNKRYLYILSSHTYKIMI